MATTSRQLLTSLVLLAIAWPSAVAQEPPLTPEEEKLVTEARKLNQEGFQLYQSGRYAEAVQPLQQVLAIWQKLYSASKYPDGHYVVAGSLVNLGGVLHAQGAFDKALPYCEQAVAMYRRLYPQAKYPGGHPNLAASLNILGLVLNAQGALEKALPCYEQALAMRRKLYPESKYPDGHRDLAQSYNNLALLLRAQGTFEKALPYAEQALAMNRKLFPEAKFPDGHPDLAFSLNNLGFLLHSQRRIEEALPYFEQGLAMRRRLYPESKYPDGHPDLANSLNNLGGLHQGHGASDKALPFYEQALEMKRRLYPEAKYPYGHPDLAFSLSNLGSLLQSQAAFEKALPHLEQALAMQSKLAREMLFQAPESDALAYLQIQPMTRDGYLSVTARLPHTGVAAYRSVWQSKAALTRVLELRHATARASGTKAAEQLAKLKEIRRRIEQLLQGSRLKPEERDRLLANSSDERDQLERELTKILPILDQWKERDRWTPEDLAKALQPESVFIDLLAYTHFEYDARRKGQKLEARVSSYVAFMVGAGRPVTRIELGPVDPIHAAVRTWREAIDRRVSAPAGEQLRTLVWQPLARHLPPGTKTIYLGVDGDLARMPWAALPIGKDRILLEDYALAAVPHGPYLLEALLHRPKFTGPESLLTLGDVSYNSKTWPTLPGTRVEIGAIHPLAPSVVTTLTKSEATAAKFAEALSQVRYAHVATHSEFQAEELIAEKNRERDARKNWHEGLGRENRPVAAQNPLGFVGLVLANGEVLTGLRLLDLPLENLKLVTLSACETGLGELTGGEGVQGLQRAFHLAGCPNVIASLWKVNDAATAALMAKFYHEMWVNKKPAVEALRESQLTIYRRPDLIPDLAGERGAPRLKEAVAVKVSAPSEVDVGAKRQARADTKLWAAFVLSGIGR